MYKATYLKGTHLNVDTVQYLRKHDLVYRSPMERAPDGIPLGTGCFGGLSYVTDNALHFLINHVDALDCARCSDFSTWAKEDEEKHTAPFGCGHLMITDNEPGFDWKYLTDFEYRLNIAQAVATLKSVTPFSDNRFRSFASKDQQVMVIEGQMNSESETQREITLERWGSRNFFHFYEQIADCPEKNLSDTSVGQKDNIFYICQSVGNNSFVTAVRVEAEGYTIQKINDRCIKCLLPASRQSHFRLLVSCVVSGNRTPDLESALSSLEEAAAAEDRLFVQHTADWKAYWEKSFLHLPQHDYLENLYYLSLYHLRCSGLGNYPHSFGSIWTWYGDSRNWGHFYHWNYQQTYWFMNAAGHPELEKNYFDYRFSMLDHAREVAKKLFGVEGAFFSDVTSLNGFQGLDPDTISNLTCGPQIASQFYHYYRYTRDETFLRERAYPFMRAVAQLYENLLQRDEDGFYRIRGGSTAYETYWNLKETITDCCAIRQLFTSLLEASRILDTDEQMHETWTDVIEHIYPVPESDYREEGCPPARIYAGGKKWDDTMAAWPSRDYVFNIFRPAFLAPVYPFSLVGLSQKDSPDFETARNSVHLTMYESLNPAKKEKAKVIGHNLVLQCAARLGMEETVDWLEYFIETFQYFTNGMCHFAHKSMAFSVGNDLKNVHINKLPRGIRSTQWQDLHEPNEERMQVSIDRFCHTYFEVTGNILDGLQEMLLQSYDGRIRVFPAVPEKFSGTFSLWAVDCMRISSQMEEGEVRFVLVEAGKNTLCRIISPFRYVRVLNEAGLAVDYRLENEELQFAAEAGHRYRIENRETPLTQYYVDEIPCERNNDAKQLRTVMLGSRKNY